MDLQQHNFFDIISRKRKNDHKRDQQKRAIIQNLTREIIPKRLNESLQNVVLSSGLLSVRPYQLAITSSLHSENIGRIPDSIQQPNIHKYPLSDQVYKNDQPVLCSKINMRDEWKRLKASSPIQNLLRSTSHQPALPKLPYILQFPRHTTSRPMITSSPSQRLFPVSAFSSTATFPESKVNGNNSKRALSEPLVEEPSSESEEEEKDSESEKNNDASGEQSEPEEEDGILIEKAIPVAKGCDTTNISSRVFLDQKYLNSLFNRSVTLDVSEISELFSYNKNANVSEDQVKNNETTSQNGNSKPNNGYLTDDSDDRNSAYSELTNNKSDDESLSGLSESEDAPYSPSDMASSPSSIFSSSENNDSEDIHNTPSTSRQLRPLSNIRPSSPTSSSSQLSPQASQMSQSPLSPQSPQSPQSPLSPLSPPIGSSRKKVSLFGVKKINLQSYSLDSEKLARKLVAAKNESLQPNSKFHASFFLDRLTSQMIDEGALLSEDEEERQKQQSSTKKKGRKSKKNLKKESLQKTETKTNKSQLVRAKPTSSPKTKRPLSETLHECGKIIRPSVVNSKSADKCRRSKRNRVRTLSYWTGQRPLYHVTVDPKGSPLKTLIGVSSGNVEQKKLRNVEKRKITKSDKSQKMMNIFNLSIDNPRFAKKFAAIDGQQQPDQEHVLAFNQVDFHESTNSPGVFTALTKKESNIAFGKLKFTPKAVKKRTKTGNYVSHFNVVYGTLLLKIENEKVGSIIKTGFYFHIGEQTNYVLTNLRNDEAMIDFTIIKEV